MAIDRPANCVSQPLEQHSKREGTDSQQSTTARDTFKGPDAKSRPRCDCIYGTLRKGETRDRNEMSGLQGLGAERGLTTERHRETTWGLHVPYLDFSGQTGKVLTCDKTHQLSTKKDECLDEPQKYQADISDSRGRTHAAHKARSGECSSGVFSAFTELCSRHHHRVPEHSISQNKTPYP